MATLQFSTLEKTLELKFHEHYFLTQIEAGLFEEKKYFSNLPEHDYDPHKMAFIIKLATKSSFEKICKKAEYNALWGKQYSLIGYALCATPDKKYNLLPHAQNNFDLLRGAYFFHQSQKVRGEMQTDFSYQERQFLNYACKYQSVHAIQRYNEYFYKMIENPAFTLEEKIAYSRKAIANTKPLVKSYGAYAYLMLSEAYYRYALLLNNQSPSKVIPAMHAADDCCERATKCLTQHPEASMNAIHNASLGRGLAYSNSFRIATPAEAQKLLILTPVESNVEPELETRYSI